MKWRNRGRSKNACRRILRPQTRNEELHRTNEELRHGLRNNQGQRDLGETERLTPQREFSTPFSQEILEALVPNTFAGPKVIFTGMEDPEAHLTAFHTQMVLVGGSDAVRCKLFMSTLTGMAMDWFISDGRGPSTSPHASPPKGRFGPTIELWPRGSKKTFFYMFKCHKL